MRSDLFALLFPGQGSQSVGMGQFLYDEYSIAKDLFQQASEILDMDMTQLCFNGPESKLQLTENTQPAILLVSIAAYRVLESQTELKIGVTAGHSVGEYAALVANGVLKFEDALRAVRARGKAMQSSVPVGEGGMTAVIGLEPAQVERICQLVPIENGPVSPANYNSPGQIVISGRQSALEWIEKNYTYQMLEGRAGTETPKKVRWIRLPVSAPFHCQMMKPAENLMRNFLSQIEFHKPHFPIVQNYTATWVTDPVEIKENLIRQICAPVKWMQSVDYLKTRGFYNYIECGSGKVLQGLLKKIDPENLRVFTTTSLEEIQLLKMNMI